MEPTLFVHKFPDHLICQLCLAVVIDPVEHTTCDKVFCGPCLTTMVSNQSCPMCKASLENTVKPLNRFIRDIYENMHILCDKQGCLATFPWPQKTVHEALCQFPIYH
jgi:hypothetical protein